MKKILCSLLFAFVILSASSVGASQIKLAQLTQDAVRLAQGNFQLDYPPRSGSNYVSQIFTPLHKYYIAATGCSDRYDGLSQTHDGGSTGPWCTPRHPVVCGDVIIALPGTYGNNQFSPYSTDSGMHFSSNFGAVTNCPSTSGGIDGNGGIYFAVLLCGASDLVGCPVTSSNLDAAIEFLNNNNWAVEGFVIPNVSNKVGMMARIVAAGGNGINCESFYSNHHLAFINNVVYNSQQGIGLNDCGRNKGINPPAIDYIAAVGNIAQNANHYTLYNSICLAAMDFVGTGATDTNTTAIKGFMAGNFAYNNDNPACYGLYDNENFMFDTLDAHASNGKWNFFNNIGFYAGRMGFQFFWQCSVNNPFTVNIYNNTLFANNSASGNKAKGTFGDLSIWAGNGCSGYNPIPVTVNVHNNISLANWASKGAQSIYAVVFSSRNYSGPSLWGLLTNGATGSENIWKAQRTSCDIYNGAGGCDPGFNEMWNDNVSRLGTNFYVNPFFKNTADLISNRLGAPNCAGFKSTTECMGYNVNTQTYTTPSIIDDLRPQCAQCTGKGYQIPATTCASSGAFHELFPPWLKGIVRLQWNSSTGVLTREADLITLPCGM